MKKKRGGDCLGKKCRLDNRGQLVLGTDILIYWILLFFSVLYIGILGKLGFQMFKYNVPLLKRRGCIYLIWEKNGRFKWVYGKFKSEWAWNDGSMTYISRNYDRISQSAEPLIFLIEGYPTNVKLSDELPEIEVSKIFTNIVKTSYSTGRLAENLSQEKSDFVNNKLPLIAAVLAVFTLAIVVMIFFNLGEIRPIIEGIKGGIEALTVNAPRELGGKI